MNDLTIKYFQTKLHWHEPYANRAMFEELLWEYNSPADLTILPEMFSTGFSMSARELAEPMNFKTFTWMKSMATQFKTVLVGSYMVEEDNQYYNRLFWINPDGTFRQYDKRHLFRMADEHNQYARGSERIIAEVKGWKVLPLICYDLRFPVWSRNNVINNDLEYDLILYIASWPSPRINAWDALLKARAIENQSYSIGVNRIGEDGIGSEYTGHSGVYDPKGNCLHFSKEQPDAVTMNLSGAELKDYRKKFPIHLDADKYSVGD